MTRKSSTTPCRVYHTPRLIWTGAKIRRKTPEIGGRKMRANLWNGGCVSKSESMRSDGRTPPTLLPSQPIEVALSLETSPRASAIDSAARRFRLGRHPRPPVRPAEPKATSFFMRQARMGIAGRRRLQRLGSRRFKPILAAGRRSVQGTLVPSPIGQFKP